MAHRTLTSADEVAAYIRYLDDGYPARHDVIAHLCLRLQQVNSVSDRERDPQILELACGPGVLAEAILKTMPVSEYVGVDITRASLDYARERVARFDARSSWLQADLNKAEWPDRLDGGFDAIVSVQSLHDLGGAAELERIVKVAYGLLAPGGWLIYADLLRSPDDADGAHPGRFPVSRHLNLLKRTGYRNVKCTLEVGGFGCFEAARPTQKPELTV
jgi:SAM-dependent methyltransferase